MTIKQSVDFRGTVMALVCAVMSLDIASAAMSVSGMKTNHEVTPSGVETAQPVFSWLMIDSDASRSQTGYEITVTDASDGTAVWTSGRRESRESINISYEGVELKPATRYDWTVTVWNNAGEAAAGKSWFETGLLHDVSMWGGAEWIGAPDSEMTFSPHYLPVFGVEYSVALNDGCCRALLRYGMNDRRLLDANRNIYHIESPRDSSYVAVEMDITDAVSGGQARLNLYRVNYAPGDRADVPLWSGVIPDSLMEGKLREPHRVALTSVLGYTRVSVDGVAVGEVNVNPVGRGGDYTAFPVVGDVALGVSDGGTAQFSDVVIRHYRHPSNVVKTVVAGDTVVSGNGVSMNIDGPGAPMLRTEFDAESNLVKRARLYVTSRGVYDFYINGKRVNSSYLNPGLTQYDRMQLYQTYDVTPMLTTGRNAMGAVLSEGWWSGGASFVGDNWNYFGDRQSLLALLRIEYDDGTKADIVTDPATWRVSTDGPTRYGSLFQGEIYDATRESEFEGWSTACFGDSSWGKAVPVTSPGFDDVVPEAQYGQGVVAVDTLMAIAVTEPRRGVYVYDMGQNIAGVPCITLSGLEPGTEVIVRFAEVLYPEMPQYAGNEGMVMLENIRAAMAQEIYTARGGVETVSPRFTYHGFRYMEITGIDRPLPLDDVRAIVLSSLDSVTASYETSNADVNRLWKNIIWSSRANLMSIPTDCPQRNERMGWAGDISVFSPAALYIGDMTQFLRRYLRSMRDTQHPDGRYEEVVPMSGGFGGLLWQSAGIVVPWECYLASGDTTIVAEHYDSMKRYVDYVAGHDIDPSTGLLVQNREWGDLGDWLGHDYDKMDKSLLWECYYIYDLSIMERVAMLLGKSDDAQVYRAMKDAREDFFVRTYVDTTTGMMRHSAFVADREGKPLDLQTTYAVPLALNVLPDSLRAPVAARLAASVARENIADDGRLCPPYSLMTGFIGTAWISNALSDNGYTDIAYKLLQQTDYPSWLYPVKQGATTVWERLNSFTLTDGFGSNNSMNSFNHYSFGAVADWMISRSLGIRKDPMSPGYRHFFLLPEVDMSGGMTWARGHYDSPYGRIESSWVIDGDTVTYEFTVPANTEATVSVPDGERIVTERLTSGKHTFVTALPAR